jgi:glycosyltransferase involved in cell wall biosynthesis
LPRVTVIIPTYNRAGLLIEAIESALRQTYRDFEIIVCDDGSTDDTAVRVRALADPVRYLGLTHTGCPGAPRNRGLDAARGELVAFLDDDDLWEPGKLARQVEVLEREPGLNVIYTDRRLLFPDGSLSAPVASPALKRPDEVLDLALGGQFPFLGTVLMRTELLRRVGGFDGTLVTGEDFELWLRAGRNVRAARIAEPLVQVRRQAGSLSDRSGPLAFENAIAVLERSLAWRDLRFSQRARCRRTLAHLHARLAARLADEGDAAASSRAALRAIRYAPTSSAAWAGWMTAVQTRFGQA